ncbi:MAG: Dna2/Cas4 domain-containing protein, partial [Paludibacteraceae bacterium]|nr:Dna2/Cas4 domain-containing protein [Paludibacteraceae bacterium]
PDRIVMVNDKVIIIDYKFGDENNKYKNQVKEYAELMKKMGYKNVEGYLWYVEQGKIENVKMSTYM